VGVLGPALDAIGRIEDGGHNLDNYSAKFVEKLRGSCIDAMAGLAILKAQLEAEIGADKL